MRYDEIEWAKVFEEEMNDFPEPIFEESKVTISEREYAALKNALRIVRDRNLQQIDKSKQDEHGYQLVKCVLDEKHLSFKSCWKITKNTPYSLKMGLQTAKSLIIQDLIEFYSFVTEDELERNRVTISGLVGKCKEYEKYKERGELDHFLDGFDDEFNPNFIELNHRKSVLKHEGIVSFDMCELSSNFTRGTYQVTYYASTPI